MNKCFFNVFVFFARISGIISVYYVEHCCVGARDADGNGLCL